MEPKDQRQTEADEALIPLRAGTVRTLVENHRQFRTFLTKRLGNEKDAEDVLQLSLKKAVEHPPDAEQVESVVAWFYKILRHTLIDHYRSQASEKKRRSEYASEIAIETNTNPLAPEDLEAGICECLKGLLPTLKPEYAEILERIDLGGQTPEGVASSLGLSRANVDVRLHRARKALKRSLERSCGTCTEHGCLQCTCGAQKPVQHP